MRDALLLPMLLLAGLGMVLSSCGMPPTSSHATTPAYPYPLPTITIGRMTAYPPPQPTAPVVQAALPTSTPISICACPAPTLGVVIDTNGTILAIDPQSAAERAGLHVGDTILAINEQALTPDATDAKQTIDRVTDREQFITIRLRRDTTIIDVAVVVAEPGVSSTPAQHPPTTPTPALPPAIYL